MRQILVVVGLSFIALASCKKEAGSSFNGRYREASPVPGRSQLEFISNNRVVKMETGSIYKDTFDYSFSADKILLKAVWANYPTQQFDFKKLDELSFQIENLYPAIPEDPETYMIFKKIADR
jgi:hypothetical protein